MLSANLKSEKGSLDNGISFNKNRVLLYLNLKNDLQISSRIFADFSFSYITGGIQGYYDISDIVDVNVGLKWQSKNKKWTIALRGNDLLNKQVPIIGVRHQNQVFRFIPPRDCRSMLFEVKYSFGELKKQTPSQLETSRF